MTLTPITIALMVIIVSGIAYAARCVWEAARAIEADQRARAEADD